MKLFISILLFISLTAGASSPLQPVKTDSPRDTMKTFMEAMNDYKIGVEKGDYKLKARINDALRCFAPAPSKTLISKATQTNAAIMLKETIDRVIILNYELIPEKPEQQRWRLKDTEVLLRPMTEGDRNGEWLITYDTWIRAKNFYKKVQSLPYLDGSGKGAYYSQPWLELLLPSWAQEESLGLKKWQWLGIFFAFILGLILKFLVQMTIRGLRILSSKVSKNLEKRLIFSVEQPLGLLAATIFWYFSLLVLKLEGLSFNILNGAIQIAFGISVIWLCYKIIGVGADFFEKLAHKTDSPLDDQLVPFAEKTLKAAVAIIGGLMVLQNMGINVFSVVAGLGLGGLAFALAAKDTAANLFGSIMILIDRPFKIGDWIIVGNDEGTVEEIGFRSTRIRTFYNSLITVPNSTMATEKIDNMGERRYRRTVERLGVTYDTKPSTLEAFIDGIKKIITNQELTRKDYFNVAFAGYKDSSLEVLVYFFIVTDDYQKELQQKQAVFLEIYHLAEKLGIEFAFPTQTLYINEESAKEQTPTLN